MWGSTNRSSTKAVEEVVLPREIPTPNITGSNEKGGKRLRPRGSLQVSEGGGKEAERWGSRSSD